MSLTSVVDGEDKKQDDEEDEDEHGEVAGRTPAARTEAAPAGLRLRIRLVRTRFRAADRGRSIGPADEGGGAVVREIS